MPHLTTKLEPKHKLFGLDHLRTLAIVYVFIYHYGRMFKSPSWITTISDFGWTGVDLFFVLSGYLISSQLFSTIAKGENISFKTFFLKRFFRIVPAYIFVVILYFLFPLFREREALAPLWKYLTFTQNIGLNLRYQGTFSHAWSLCIEEQFYLCLPLILMALIYFKAIKKGFILIALLFLFGLFIRFYVWQKFVLPFADEDGFGLIWYKYIYYPTYSRLDGLLAGVTIAGLFQFKPKIKQGLQQYGNLLLLASMIVLAAAYFLCSDQKTFSATVFGFPVVAIGYGLMVLSAISPTSILYKFKSKATSTIASLSYAIYLTHKIIIHLTQINLSKLNIAKDSNLMFVICIITSLLGAFIFNRIIEKPFFKWRNLILKSNQNN